MNSASRVDTEFRTQNKFSEAFVLVVFVTPHAAVWLRCDGNNDMCARMSRVATTSSTQGAQMSFTFGISGITLISEVDEVQ